MLLGAGIAFLFLAGSTTQGWMGFTDFQWMMMFAAAGITCIALHYIIKWRQERFKAAVEREVNRRIYHYKKLDY